MKRKGRANRAVKQDRRPSFSNNTFDQLAKGVAAYQEATSKLASAGVLYRKQKSREHRPKQCFGRSKFIAAYLKTIDNVSLAPTDINRWMSEIDSNPGLVFELSQRGGCVSKNAHLELIQNPTPNPCTAKLSVALYMDDKSLFHLVASQTTAHSISLEVSQNIITFRCPWDIRITSSRSIIKFNDSAPSQPIRTSLQRAAINHNQMHAYQFQVPGPVLFACRQGRAHEFIHQCKVSDAKTPFVQRLLDAAFDTEIVTCIEVEYRVMSSGVVAPPLAPNATLIPIETSTPFGVFRAPTFINVAQSGSM